MFYLIIGILLALYYFFMAPKTIKSTMNIVIIVGAAAFALVWGGMGLVHLVQSPPEIFLGILMTFFGIYVLRDVVLLEPKTKKQKVELEEDEETVVEG